MSDHGWPGTKYVYEGCRCDPCRDANRRRCARWRNRHYGVIEPPRHGASGRSNYGCECSVCVEAHKARCRAYNARRKEIALPEGSAAKEKPAK